MERVQRIKYLFALAAGVGCLLAAFQVKAQTYPLSTQQASAIRNTLPETFARAANDSIFIQPNGNLHVVDYPKPVRMPSGATVGISAGNELAKTAAAAAAAKGIMRLGTKAIPYVGLALTAYDLYQLLNGKGGFLVDSESGLVTGYPPLAQDGYEWYVDKLTDYEPVGLCHRQVATWSSPASVTGTVVISSTQVRCNVRYAPSAGGGTTYFSVYRRTKAGLIVPRVPQTESQIAEYLINNPALMNSDTIKNAVRDGILEAMKTINPADISNLPQTIILPDGTKLQPLTKTKIDTKTETRTATRNGVNERIETTTETYAELGPDGKVKLETKTIEVVQPLDTAGNPSGEPSSSTTTTAPAPAEEAPGICDLFPDILACKKLDEVADEPVKKETKTITLQEADLGFGGGKCPDNVVSTINGKPLTIIDMQQSCGIVSSYVKPLILLLSSFISMMIIFAGITKTEL